VEGDEDRRPFHVLGPIGSQRTREFELLPSSGIREHEKLRVRQVHSVKVQGYVQRSRVGQAPDSGLDLIEGRGEDRILSPYHHLRVQCGRDQERAQHEGQTNTG
jgi:hypothetical protein